jgi:excisionase family DNA binding protein
MLIELDDRDIERVANKVLEALKPLLKSPPQKDDQEAILDVEGLASYLKVKTSWIYEKTHLNEIPFYKVGKFPRFRKKDIDQWLNSNFYLPIDRFDGSKKVRLLTK